MKRFKFIHRSGWYYVFIRLPFHKNLEMGFQLLTQYDGWSDSKFDYEFKLNFAGRDHAGLKTYLQLWKIFFEFNIQDCRHWDYNNNRWLNTREISTEVCDEGQITSYLHRDKDK